MSTLVPEQESTYKILHDRRQQPFALCVATKSPLVDIARVLMGEYAALPHTVGRWTTAAADIGALPTPYVPPRGVLLVALEAEHLTDPTTDLALGCGALGTLPSSGACELKRIYVRPPARGRGIGEAITLGLLEWADSLGFQRVCLDTAPELHAAITLYHRLGFRSIPPYKAGLLPDALCFERAVHI
jgi:putative acetyltransferase